MCLSTAAAPCCRQTPPSPVATAPSTHSPTPRPAPTPCACTPPWTASAATSCRRTPRPAACPTPAWETPGGPTPHAVSCHLVLTHTDQKFRNSEILRTCWWSSLSSLPAASAPTSCLTHYCSNHEFCGDNYGTTRCFCRAGFSYKHNNTFGMS